MSALSPMVRGYLEAALWASSDEDGEPLDDGRDLDDFAPSAIDRAIADCAAFLGACTPEDLDAYREGFPRRVGALDVDDFIGHDLWLTRNGHGAGFWDRGLGAVGERLSAAADAMGPCGCYVGDDGLIYLS